ncbi:MAG: twin-arginine translocase TatA/TatE family subunit [Dethiobacter sp.]|jgi:sec-independent protein translocase protein TatA|nr:twin-arginine translocase TatA/TatE family subunit [Dethiobacter sp.]
MLGRIGPLELIVVLAIILLIFGPSKLPGLAKAVGRSVVELKDGLKGGKPATDEPPSSAEENNK